jgi:hypothetical protein
VRVAVEIAAAVAGVLQPAVETHGTGEAVAAPDPLGVDVLIGSQGQIRLAGLRVVAGGAGDAGVEPGEDAGVGVGEEILFGVGDPELSGDVGEPGFVGGRYRGGEGGVVEGGDGFEGESGAGAGRGGGGGGVVTF